jgi:hydroxymethylglutaryl-CoA lyase
VTEVIVTDVALRDGLQDEDTVVPTPDKLVLARELVGAGFTSLEIGSFVHPGKVPQMADTDELVTRLVPELPATLHALVFNERGARRAVAAGARSVRFVVSASDGHSTANAGVDTAGALDRLAACVPVLAEAGVAVEACIATAFTCPYDGETPVDRVLAVADRLVLFGVGVLHLADTIGSASPRLLRRAFDAVRDRHPDLPLGVHLHNTYGLASANALQALQLGIRRFDAALGGIGGCPFAPGAAGNIATDDLVDLLHKEGFATGIDPAKLVAVRDRLRAAVGHPLPSALAAIPAAPAAPVQLSAAAN